MNAGKSTILLQAAHNYRERGMDILLLTAALDHRAGMGRIASRIGFGADAMTFDKHSSISKIVHKASLNRKISCILIDEAQFLSASQVWDLSEISDQHNIPVMCYGLRTDFRGQLFEGSATLLAIADHLREIRTICHCGRKAVMVAKQAEDGHIITKGQQIEIGGNDKYISLCRLHWKEVTGYEPKN